MLRIAKLTDYATVLMVRLARDPARCFRQRNWQTSWGALPTVAKLLKSLLQARLLTARGVRWCYTLAHAPHAISVADVVNAIEGRGLDGMLAWQRQLLAEKDCATRANWQLISHAVRWRWKRQSRRHGAARMQTIRMPGLQEKHMSNIDVIRPMNAIRNCAAGSRRISLGLRHRHRAGDGAQGAERGRHPADLGQEERARIHARLAAAGLPPLADAHRATWSSVHHPPIDYQAIHYYAGQRRGRARSRRICPKSTRNCCAPTKSSASLQEREALAGVAWTRCSTRYRSPPPSRTSWRASASFSARSPKRAEASRAGARIPRLGGAHHDNYFATLNSAVFTDGSFVYVPKGVRCRWSCRPISASTRRTPDSSSAPHHCRRRRYVSYLEGCTAPMRDENQLHAAVVELVALKDARIKYSTVQNWYPGDARGVAESITSSPNAVTAGDHAQFRGPGRDRLAITWKYPSCICAATTASASSIRWRSPTTASRPTPAPR